jgi:hypothetical protein
MPKMKDTVDGDDGARHVQISEVPKSAADIVAKGELVQRTLQRGEKALYAGLQALSIYADRLERSGPAWTTFRRAPVWEGAAKRPKRDDRDDALSFVVRLFAVIWRVN